MDKKEIESHLKNSRICIHIKPNAKENKIVKWENDMLYVDICEPAQDDKANKELLKYLSKLMKRKCHFVSGLRSREKVIEFI